MESAASIADRTMIGRSARALISRASDDGEVGPAALQPPQRLHAVAGSRHVVAVVAQLLGQDDEQVRIVVDEEEPGRPLLPRRPAADHHGASIPRSRARSAAPAGRRLRRAGLPLTIPGQRRGQRPVPLPARRLPGRWAGPIAAQTVGSCVGVGRATHPRGALGRASIGKADDSARRPLGATHAQRM